MIPEDQKNLTIRSNNYLSTQSKHVHGDVFPYGIYNIIIIEKSKTHKIVHSECQLRPVFLRVLCCFMCLFLRAILS